MMVLMERWGKYWVCYYGVFLAILASLLASYWSALDWRDESWLLLLAAIFGVSAGMALTITIIVEGLASMVLLIPKVAEKLRAEGEAIGFAKGEASGLEKGEASGLEKAKAWLERKAAAERAGLPFDEPFPG